MTTTKSDIKEAVLEEEKNARKKRLNKRKEKKARKLIAKIEKKREKKREKDSWAKYEEAGCFACNKGQIIKSGRTELDITSYSRCKCANVQTKKYKKYLKKKPSMTVAESLILECKFYDNNSDITVGNNAEDRSW